MRSIAAAMALVAGLSGCAVNQFVCARKGGWAWRELRTEHFLLQTDHPAERARELALELERLRDALAHTLVDAPASGGALVHVVAMRSPYAWQLFSPSEDAWGLFTHSWWGEPTIVFPGYLDGVKRRVIAHELTHLLYSAGSSRQPAWFREGIASYAETLEISASDDRITLGGVSAARALSVTRFLRGGMREVLVSRGLSAHQYGLAWILVHFLITEHPDELGQLEDRFSRAEDPQEAWRAVFPEWDPALEGGPARLEDALWSYASGRAKSLTYRHRALASIPPPRERPLSAAEVHDLRLALPWPNLGEPLPRERRIEEATEALQESPGNPTATLVLGLASEADARRLAEDATRARPDDARNWLLLGAALPGDDLEGREAAFRRAVSIDASSPVASDFLARHLLERHRAQEALPHARRAVELAPWSPSVLHTASGVLEDLGNCRGALVLAERAISSMGDRADRELRDALSARRDRLARSCGQAR